MASYNDIARLTGLSLGTISNVLQGKPTVKRENVAKVMDAVNKLGYRINYQARGLASEKSRLIGLVIANPHNPQEAKVLMSMENFAEQHGYRIMWGTSRFQKEREVKNCEIMLSSKVDGLFVFMQSTENQQYFLDLASREKTPIILLGRYFDEIRLPYVAVDNYFAAGELVRYIHKKGHRSLMYLDVGELSALSPNRDRRKGVQKSCEEMGIELTVREYPLRDSDFDTGFLAGQEMALSGNLPPLVMPRDDAFAVGLFNAFLRYGINVPEDISIVSFGHFYSDHITPKRLTTFHPEFERVVEKATQIFLELQDNQDDDVSQATVSQYQCFIRGHLVEGETVADIG